MNGRRGLHACDPEQCPRESLGFFCSWRYGFALLLPPLARLVSKMPTVGQVGVSRGDKLNVDFVNSGRKTLLKVTKLNHAVAPGESCQVFSGQRPTSHQKIEGEESSRKRQSMNGTLATDMRVDPCPVDV